LTRANGRTFFDAFDGLTILRRIVSGELSAPPITDLRV
jgi:hypothetical protein